jgi:hypothetical protein
MGDNTNKPVDAYQVDENGCWRWLGNKTWKGYGYISGHRKAHREYYTRYVGEIPAGLYVLHKCDVKDCVNPEHLYVGTHADNMKDCVERGQSKSPDRQRALLRAQYASHQASKLRAEEKRIQVSSSKQGVK